MNTKLIVSSFVANLLFGAFMFVFGGADDSPGAQLLGLVVVGIGAIGLARILRHKKQHVE